MRSIQEFAAYGGRNKFSTPFNLLDIRKQITVILHLFGHSHQSRDKTVSDLTKKARAYISFQFLNDLRESGFGIKNVLNLDQRHIRAIIEIWQKDNLSASTMQGRLSVLRWFSTAIGKPGLVLAPESYGLKKEKLARTYVAKVDKSWSSHESVPKDLIDKVEIKDQWVGIQLKMMSAFGLRIRESVLIRPAYSDSGTVLTVEEGTKGGRTRTIPILTPEQRVILDCAIKMAKTSERGALVPPGKTPEQAVKRVYYVCGLFGITKDQLEITPHGLRHQYANDRYEEVSGVPSSVRGGTEIPDIESDSKARDSVTRELGHARHSITRAYTGARVPSKKRIEKLHNT